MTGRMSAASKPASESPLSTRAVARASSWSCVLEPRGNHHTHELTCGRSDAGEQVQSTCWIDEGRHDIREALARDLAFAHEELMLSQVVTSCNASMDSLDDLRTEKLDDTFEELPDAERR